MGTTLIKCLLTVVVVIDVGVVAAKLAVVVA